jgi:glycosyltransferase involved in cell wall biosynthesis
MPATVDPSPKLAHLREVAARRLRVLVITRIFPNAVEPLAAPFNRQQFGALGRLCDVEVMATIPWFPGARLFERSNAGRLGAVPARDVIEGISVSHPRVAYVPRWGAGLSGVLEVASLLRDVLPRRGDVDVVLGSWAFPEGAAAVALSRMIGVPAVIKVHGSDLNLVSTMRGPRANLRLALPRAARIVAVSRALGDKAVELGADPARIAVVANGTDASLFFVRDRREARRALGLSSEGRVVLYVGRVERDKGALDLVEAFARIAPAEPDLSLVILGQGRAMDEAKSLAAPLGERVRFLGGRPLAEVPVWMGASTLVTLPSWAEGSPNVVREALACGRPVVATRVGGVPELLTSDALGEMVPAKDPAALGRALASVSKETYDANVLRAASGGSWDDSARALLRVLEDARAEGDRARRG